MGPYGHLTLPYLKRNDLFVLAKAQKEAYERKEKEKAKQAKTQVSVNNLSIQGDRRIFLLLQKVRESVCSRTFPQRSAWGLRKGGGGGGGGRLQDSCLHKCLLSLL